MDSKHQRRRILGIGAGLAASPFFRGLPSAHADETPSAAVAGGLDEPFTFLDLETDGPRDLARRATVLVPRDLPPGSRVPLLVLLHGLGETKSEALGVRAWIDRYGLVSCHRRLVHPPVAAESKRGDLTPAHVREINEELARRPYTGRAVIVCPFTPNVWRFSDPRRTLDRYAEWITDVLLPDVRSRTPADDLPARTAIDGCSLGGYVGLEVFLRRPRHFGVWGGVQAAFGVSVASAAAERIAAAIGGAGPRRIHIETSLGDPFYRANLALSRELRKKGIAHDFAALPGPHDQPWLREAGTLEMLLWHDRALSDP